MATYDKATLEKLGNDVLDCAGQYGKEIDNIYEQLATLRTEWQGTDSDRYATATDGYKEQLENLKPAIAGYGDSLLYAASLFGNVTDTVADNASGL